MILLIDKKKEAVSPPFFVVLLILRGPTLNQAIEEEHEVVHVFQRKPFINAMYALKVFLMDQDGRKAIDTIRDGVIVA